MGEMMNIWQVSAGDSRRDFSDLFLKYDVMLAGPGRFGPYSKECYAQVIQQGLYTSTKIGYLRAFVEKANTNDIVLLRDGSKFKAIGVLSDEPYFHSEIFDDIYGWDLQHARRVVWQEHLQDDLIKLGLSFGSGKQASMFSGVNKSHIADAINPLQKAFKNRKLKALPSEAKSLSLEDFGEELFSRGLPNNSVDQLIKAIERQRRLIRWYNLHGKESDRPTEHEIVAHMVLPLLLALGWSEQLLAIEWKRVDLAAFTEAPTIPPKCCLVCEAKRFGHGLQNVFKQAANYVKSHKLINCEKILLTQGKILYLYEKSGKEWSDKPVGYLNIDKIRTHYLIPEGANAVETIMALTPSGIHKKISGK
jgi:hypothetical protein